MRKCNFPKIIDFMHLRWKRISREYLIKFSTFWFSHDFFQFSIRFDIWYILLTRVLNIFQKIILCKKTSVKGECNNIDYFSIRTFFTKKENNVLQTQVLMYHASLLLLLFIDLLYMVFRLKKTFWCKKE